MPVDRGYHQLLCVLDPHQRFIAVQTEEVAELRSRALQHLYVCTSAEKLIASAANDYDVHILVQSGLEYAVIQVPHHIVGIGIGRWVVQLDYRYALIGPVVDQPILCRFFTHFDSPHGPAPLESAAKPTSLLLATMKITGAGISGGPGTAAPTSQFHDFSAMEASLFVTLQLFTEHRPLTTDH